MSLQKGKRYGGGSKKKKEPEVEEATPATEPAMATMGDSNVVPNIPDLDMSDVPLSEDQRREQRMEELAAKYESSSTSTNWFDETEESLSKTVLQQQSSLPPPPPSPQVAAEEQSRFAAQLSGDWNSKVMAAGDKLTPLAAIMERLAILEEEKKAADARLEEEFRLRGELEEKYYREKRDILEGAAAEVQISAYEFDIQSDVKGTDSSVPVNGTNMTKADNEASVLEGKNKTVV